MHKRKPNIILGKWNLFDCSWKYVNEIGQLNLHFTSLCVNGLSVHIPHTDNLQMFHWRESKHFQHFIMFKCKMLGNTHNIIIYRWSGIDQHSVCSIGGNCGVTWSGCWHHPGSPSGQWRFNFDTLVLVQHLV